MGTVSSLALVYTAGRRDTGKRTWSFCRGYTPDHKRSVLLTAPQPVEPGASRVGCAQPQPKAPVSLASFAPLELRRDVLCKSCIRSARDFVGSDDGPDNLGEPWPIASRLSSFMNGAGKQPDVDDFAWRLT
jgi:hypothetical protein